MTVSAETERSGRRFLGTTARSSLRSSLPLWALTLFVIIVAAMWLPPFRRETSINSLLASFAPLLLVATGQGIVILRAGIDLSVGSTIGLVTVLIASPYLFGDSALLVLAGALLAGVAIGLANAGGVLAGVNPLIMTLATLGMVQGIALLVLPQPGGDVPRGVIEAVTVTFGFVPVTFVAGVFGLLIAWYATTQTRWGRVLIATGFDEQSARRTGLPWRRMTLIAYTATAFFATLAGLAVIARTYSGDALAGTGYVLDSVTAVLIAGIALMGGRGSLLAVFPAALLLAVADQVITLSGANSYYQYVIKGLILIGAMWLYQFSGSPVAFLGQLRGTQADEESGEEAPEEAS